MHVRYEVLTEDGLDLIGPLWLELRQMHRARSVYFKEQMGSRSFDERREELLEKATGGLMRVELARDEIGRIIGYCVSSINSEMVGEVDSIYVTISARGLGIGTELMVGAMKWMDTLGVKRRVLMTIVGNEDVHEFYRKFGFYPKSVLLERSSDNTGDRASNKPI